MALPALAAARLACGALVLGGASVFAATSAIPEPPLFSVHWVADSTAGGGKMAVVAAGLTSTALQKLRDSNWPLDRWQELLAVYAEATGVPATVVLPPMLGSYRVADAAIRFEPQFPLQTGVAYRAVFRPGALDSVPDAGRAPLVATYQVPVSPAGPETRVSAIYPSADALPENLLKFYLHFSAPMSGGHIYQHIHLRDEHDRNVELPFLELEEELWDPWMTRLTLLLDPGRIKRGVRPLEEIGPALVAGGRYTLVIDRAWRDATGRELATDARKAFRVTPPDRDPPDPTQWQIRPPTAGTREPLEVTLSESLDRALALRLIRVATAGGAGVNGETALGPQERQWNFVPTAAWRSGSYQLVIATTIEDLAGNNIGKPFDVDLSEATPRSAAREPMRLPFAVR